MKQIFTSENIRYVAVSELLIKDYLRMVNDVEHVQKYLGGQHEPYTEEQEIRWVREKLEEKAPVFSMLEKKSGRFIGNVELMDVSSGAGEVGIAITAEMQDRGYGTEAVRAVTAYGLERLKLRRVFLRTNPKNSRAIHVYEKCSFREYDRTEEHVFMEYTPYPFSRPTTGACLPLGGRRMYYEEFKSLIGAVLRQGLRGNALADALAKSVDCGKIYESEDRLATDAYFSLLHYAAGEEEIPSAEWESFLDCLNGDREYNLEDKLKI